MDVARSSFYAEPVGTPADAVIVAEIRNITDEFEGYGYRRVDAELRHRGFVVNAKKVRRLMKENDLNPRRRRRFVRTTDSDHDSPIFPFVAKGFEAHGPDQQWVADLTYITIAGGFAYAALILDAWSRGLARKKWRAFSSLPGPFARRRWGFGSRAMNVA